MLHSTIIYACIKLAVSFICDLMIWNSGFYMFLVFTAIRNSALEKTQQNLQLGQTSAAAHCKKVMIKEKNSLSVDQIL